MFQLTFGLLTLLRHMKQPHPSTYHTKPSERVGGFSKKVEVPFTVEMLLRSIDLGICPRSIFHGTEFSSNRKGWVFPKAFEVSVSLRVHGRPREMAMVREALPQPRPPAPRAPVRPVQNETQRELACSGGAQGSCGIHSIPHLVQQRKSYPEWTHVGLIVTLFPETSF